MAQDISEWLEGHRVDVSNLADDTIVGIGHVMTELRSIAGRLRHPEIVAAAGAQLPRGLLFYGPPGTGKSTCARWLARSIGDELPFYELAADELSPTRIRAIFRALAGVRCCLFIDEIDAVGLNRDWLGAGTGQASLRALLAGLDGLLAAPGPLVVAATTRMLFELDPALVRAGRLGFHVQFDTPNETERAELLEVFSRRHSIASDIAWAAIAVLTPGTTPADLRQALDDALGHALGEDRTVINQADCLAAVGRAGEIEPEVVIPASWDRRRSVIHESGHVAVIAALLDPAQIRRVELGPRDSTTRFGDPTRPMHSVPDDELRQTIAVGYGGLAAERSLCGRPTMGSSDDIARATQLIERLLSSGLSPFMPPLAYHLLDGVRSERLKTEYDAALTREADQAYAVAEAIVAANQDSIGRFADAFATVDELAGEALAEAIRAAGFCDAAGEPIGAGADAMSEPAA